MNDDIADAEETGVSNNFDPNLDPIPEVKPDFGPVTKKPIRVEPSPMPEPDIVDVGRRDKPDVPPVVVTEPDPEPKVAVDLIPGDQLLRTRAIGLILDARKKRDKDLARQPSSREEAIDEAYRSAIIVIRDAYATRLEKSAGETSDAQLKPRLLAQAERAADLDAWIGLLSPEPKRISKKNFDGFVGNWDHSSNGEGSRRIAHPGGRFEIVGKDWKATWKIVKDGTLVVDSGKIRPAIYTRDGEGWTGEGPFGQDITLKRGDW
jgi:hypothetical protein